MKCKKLAALALTGVMTLSLAAPAFAAGTSTKITGLYKEIPIEVSVQPTGSAVINPYSMPMKAKADDLTTEFKELTTAGQIATNPLVMYNKTEIDLDVGATVSVALTKGSTLEIVQTKVNNVASGKTPAETAKKAQVFLEATRNTTLTDADVDTAATPDTTANICGIDGNAVVTAFNSWEAEDYAAANAYQILANPDEAVTKEKIALLSGGLADADGDVSPSQGSFVLYRLSGSVTKNPEEAWTAKDGFDVNVAFTFTPAETEEGGAISIAASNKLSIAAPSGVTLSGDETYRWQLIDATDASKVESIEDATTATPTLKASSTTSVQSGESVTVKCTVTDGDTIYVTTQTVTTV